MSKALFLMSGFARSDYSKDVRMIVEADMDSFELDQQPHTIAEKIAGPDYCFQASENMSASVSVPPDVIGVLMTQEELYQRVPELNPKRPRRRR